MVRGYLNACRSKRQHETKTDAQAHRRAMVAKGRWRMESTTIYRCIQCGTYHCGRTNSKTRSKGKGRR